MNRNRGISNGIVTIGILSSIIIAAGAITYSSGYVAMISAKPEQVELSGKVTTTRTAGTPENITFTSISDGMTYVAACEEGRNPAGYSISLPNEDTYTVTVTSQIFGLMHSRDTEAGTLNLNETATSLVKNWED